MAQEQAPPSGPDLTQGVAFADLVDGKLVGHVGDEEVLLVRSGSELFAIGAHCTHYHGPLADGIVVGDSVRCPWHHACFDLRTGEARARAGLEPGRLLEGRAARRPDLRQGKARATKAAARATGERAATNRHRRRRCGGLCGGRDAAAAGLRRQHRHAEQRCSAAGRPAQSVEGLSRRQRAGGLAAAAAGRRSTPRTASTCASTPRSSAST